MTSFTIKKVSALTAAFITTYYALGFIAFAGVLSAFVAYLLMTRRLKRAQMSAAGIPILLAIFLIALVSFLVLSPYSFSFWNTAKDGFFFIAPVLMLLTGLLIMRSENDFEPVLKTAINILTLATIALYSDFLFGGRVTEVSLETRYSYGLDSTSSAIAILLILALRPSFTSIMASPQYSTLFFLNIALVAVSLSRVNIAILLMAMVFVFSHSRLVRGAVIVTISLLMFAPLMQISSSTAAIQAQSDSSGFLAKVQGSLQEFRISDYSEMGDINDYWRGYEAFLGVEQVGRVGGAAHLIGLGFGSFATGPFRDKLTVIPFFHNGYVTIYLKAGLAGLALFAFFAVRLYRLARYAFRQARLRADPRLIRAGTIIALLTTSILLRTLTTHGVYYSQTTLELFFIGVAIHDMRIALGKYRGQGAVI